LSPADLGLLTTGEIKRNESGIAEAANLLNVPLLISTTPACAPSLPPASHRPPLR
jgi:cobalamin biosynthesis protein CbiG